MNNYLVVGGNGFLGSYVTDRLIQLGHFVTVLDRSTPTPRHMKMPNYRWIEADFNDFRSIEIATKNQRAVFHFLSATSPLTSLRDPAWDVRSNLLPTIELLKNCVQSGVQFFYFASSGGAIYGNSESERAAELDLALPTSPYAVGKLAAEGMLRHYQAEYGLNTVSFRISNPYGPSHKIRRDQGIIPIAIRHALEGSELTVYGDGNSVRDYLYVEDFSDMLVNATESNHKHDLYNIGSGAGASVNEILRRVQEVTGKKLLVNFQPAPNSFVFRNVLDTSRYLTEFGPQEITNLDEGISKTYDSMKSYMRD